MNVPGSGEDLARHEKGNQHLDEVRERGVARDEVVLVAPVRVARGVRVVLEGPDVPRDAVLGQATLSALHEILHDSLPRPVARHQVEHLVAFGRRILGMESGVDVEARAVRQEDVRRQGARHHFLEQVARENLDGNRRVSVPRARHAVLALEAEDPAPHRIRDVARPVPLTTAGIVWTVCRRGDGSRAAAVALPPAAS